MKTPEQPSIPGLKKVKFSNPPSTPRTVRFLKIFIISVAVCFLSYAVFLAFLVFLMSMATTGFLYGAVGVVIVLCGGAFILMVVEFYILKRNFHQERKSTRQISVTVEGEYDKVFDQCEKALAKMKATIISIDRDQGVFQARTKMSWLSFGEQLNITVAFAPDPDCLITLKSEAIVPDSLLNRFHGVQKERNLDEFLENL